MTPTCDDLTIKLLIHQHLLHTYEGIPFAEFCPIGYHPNQIDKKLEKMVKRGLIDCGVSARTGWVTELGMSVLTKVPEEVVVAYVNLIRGVSIDDYDCDVL